MEIKGKVIAKPESKSGISAKGAWKKAFLVIRYEEGQYPKDIILTNLKNSDEFEQIQVGATGTFKFDANARENKGIWFCDLNCWTWKLEDSKTEEIVADPPSTTVEDIEDAPF